MMATVTKSKQLYTLQRPTWFEAANLNMGIRHDRQHLGIILAKGQTIRIRQNNPLAGPVNLRLMNDYCGTEISVAVGNAWVTCTASAASVPFIDTLYDRSEPIIEFQYDDSAKTLPVFNSGDSESDFFKLWDSQSAEFALIESPYINLLVPAVDKQALRTLYATNPVEELIKVYNELFEFYNDIAGISFNAESATDRNIPSRYFARADKNGAGGGYYGLNWIAESTASIAGFYLDCNQYKELGWGGLHEIAHGYQGHFMNESVSEVWNNIYCAWYQHTRMGERQYKEGWLYGRQSVIEGRINDAIKNNTPLNSLDVACRLYFYMQLIHKAGIECFTHFNQRYRQLANTDGFIASNYVLPDLLSESFMTGEKGVDVTPYMQLLGLPITERQCMMNQFSGKKAVYPLNQLVSASQVSSVQSQLRLQSPLTLVDCQQLKSTGLKSTMTLSFTLDDFAQIRGETLALLDGATVVRQLKITSQQVTLSDMPIGVYALRLPTGKSKKYTPQINYLVVKTDSKLQQISFTPKAAPAVINQTLTFLGISDKAFGSATVEYQNSRIHVQLTDETPHSYFPNENYVEIVIRNKSNAERYRKLIKGTNNTMFSDLIDFTPGDTIEIIHQEPSRLRVSSASNDMVDTSSKSNVYEITAWGLRNKRTNNDPKSDLVARIDATAQVVARNVAMVEADYAPLKDDLYLAIMALDNPQRDTLRAQYYLYLSAHNTLSDDPDEPVDPVEPVEPETPDEPVEPETPDEPVEPETPDEPVEPEAPYPAWSATKTYSTYGEKVTYKRKVYRQNFYSINKAPDTNSAPFGEPWVYLNDY